jgi:orotidine-5'-phosphate decarboxylase
MNPIFCAFDMPEVAAARELAQNLDGHIGGIKMGLEFFMANGPAGVREVSGAGRLPVFLDVKLHDIPNTVAGAVRSILPLKPSLVTIHTSGGPAMMKAAADAAAEAGTERPKLIGVTVLTSLDDADLKAVGVTRSSTDQVVALAQLAKDSGLDGAVCSPLEVAALRAACGPDFMLVVPGIRPAGGEMGDQKRVMTPREALDAGADVLVIGRPITKADNPAAAAAAIAQEISSEIGGR